MRRPHVFERSVPRPRRDASNEPRPDTVEVAREIALRLPELTTKAEAAGLTLLAYTLELARIEAESVMRGSGIGSA